MTDLAIVMAVLAAALAVSFASAAAITYGPDILRRRTRSRSWLDDAMRTRMLVQTRDGQTIEGSLVRADGDGLVLHPARYGSEALSGSVWVPRDQVVWCQQPDGA